ncbi:MAG: hypothetical protein ACYS14_08160 [Planctomycetota bacterium]|jgi:hypothetical protein
MSIVEFDGIEVEEAPSNVVPKCPHCGGGLSARYTISKKTLESSSRGIAIDKPNEEIAIESAWASSCSGARECIDLSRQAGPLGPHFELRLTN